MKSPPVGIIELNDTRTLEGNYIKGVETMREMSQEARDKQREYMREWRKANREKQNKYLREWRNRPENKHKQREYNRRHWEKKAAEDMED